MKRYLEYTVADRKEVILLVNQHDGWLHGNSRKLSLAKKIATAINVMYPLRLLRNALIQHLLWYQQARSFEQIKNAIDCDLDNHYFIQTLQSIKPFDHVF